MRLITGGMLVGALVVLSACPQLSGVSGGSAGSSKLKVALSHVAPITKDLGHYTLWAGAAGSLSAVQTFLVAADGSLTTLSGQPWDGTATIAAASLKQVQVTQELPGSTDQKPGKQVFLQGAIANNSAALTSPAVFDAGALEGSVGRYLLDNVTTHQMNGICFQNNLTGHPLPGLTLPLPPSGWMFESWIQLKGHWLALGKFADASQTDDWNGYSGNNQPPFPGEDFNQGLPADIATGSNLPDLRGSQLIVSVETATLNHEEVYPSPLRVFTTTIPADALHVQTYPMTNVAAGGMPSGTLTVN